LKARKKRKRKNRPWQLSKTGKKNDGGDVFILYRAIQTDGFKIFAEGRSVSFDADQCTKGPAAENLKPC